MSNLSRTRDTMSRTRDKAGDADVRWLLRSDLFKERMRRPGAVKGRAAQARTANVSRSTLGRLLGREVEPSLGVAMSVAALAETTVEKLFEPVPVQR